MQILHSIQAGAPVEARGRRWSVVHVEQFDDCPIVTLRGTGDGNLGATTALLTPFDHLNTSPQQHKFIVARRRSTLIHAARAIAGGHGWSELWTIAAADIHLLPWQLEPAMSAVAG